MVDYNEFVSWLRLFDALCAAFVTFAIAYKGTVFWHAYNLGEKAMHTAFGLYTGAVSYTSFELFQQEVQVGLRSYIILAANVITVYALFLYKEPRKHGNDGV